ncbi:exosporium protein C [Cohnella sp. CFH 77786]|uniref:exosporium protein C n=1 Tax=Cohnella sp. CFH 77786 TaxID=2662265 RepID=UPI001C60D4C2|nr:exosporium protein C [Cohnella sp. CFH 77786]MBW5447403.1 exosporium protein C [Cohnella sp. CFH 77786]
MAQIIAYQASVPSGIFGGTNVAIPVAPGFVTLADFGINLPSPANLVELKGTIGLSSQGSLVVQVTIRILRDGFPIYTTVQGIENNTFEVHYTVSELAIDFDVPAGFHVYSLQAQIAGGSASTQGPIEFSGTAITIP